MLRPLQHRLFKTLKNKTDAHYGSFITYRRPLAESGKSFTQVLKPSSSIFSFFGTEVTYLLSLKIHGGRYNFLSSEILR